MLLASDWPGVADPWGLADWLAPPGVADPWGPESAGGLDPKKTGHPILIGSMCASHVDPIKNG